MASCGWKRARSGEKRNEMAAGSHGYWYSNALRGALVPVRACAMQSNGSSHLRWQQGHAMGAVCCPYPDRRRFNPP